jgi:hypothetical protein
MTRYEISLNDGSTDKVESATYSVDGGWVFFHGEKGEPTYAYPAMRVERITTAKTEDVHISFRVSDALLHDADHAASVSKLIRESARWGVL